MAKYINKAELAAELEKAIDGPAPSHDQQCPWEDGYYCGLYKAESILETIETKEVDLEKEIDKIWNPRFNLGWDEKSLLSINHEGFTTLAKHFYELGLNAKE